MLLFFCITVLVHEKPFSLPPPSLNNNKNFKTLGAVSTAFFIACLVRRVSTHRQASGGGVTDAVKSS
jgi:hypothetical protein